MKKEEQPKRPQQAEEKRPYSEPTLEKREQLVQVTASSPGPIF
jgi:hypothetical protein